MTGALPHLVFVALSNVRGAGQVTHQSPLYWDPSEVLSRLDGAVGFGRRVPEEKCLPYPSHRGARRHHALSLRVLAGATWLRYVLGFSSLSLSTLSSQKASPPKERGGCSISRMVRVCIISVELCTGVSVPDILNHSFLIAWTHMHLCCPLDIIQYHFTYQLWSQGAISGGSWVPLALHHLGFSEALP